MSSVQRSHDIVPVAVLDVRQDSDTSGQGQSRKASSVSSCSSRAPSAMAVPAAVDLESGHPEIKSQLDQSERDCRICHLSLDASDHDSDAPIELGCSCKDDLAAAHRHCAETWFKIKGDKTCEICGSIAHNISANLPIGPQDHANDPTLAMAAAPMEPIEARNFWQGRRFLNFVLACVIFAFVISWLFHFNVPS